MSDWPIKVLSFFRIAFYSLAVWQLVGIAGLLPQTENPDTLRQPAIQGWVAIKLALGGLLASLAVGCGWAKKRLLQTRVERSTTAPPTSGMASNGEGASKTVGARPPLSRGFAIGITALVGIAALAVVFAMMTQSNSTTSRKGQQLKGEIISNGDSNQQKPIGQRGTSNASNRLSNPYRPPEIGGKSAVVDPAGYTLAKLAAIGHTDCTTRKGDDAKSTAAIFCVKRGERGDVCTDSPDGWETIHFRKPGDAKSQSEEPPEYPIEVNFCPEFGGKAAWLKLARGMTRDQLTQLLGPPDRSDGNADGVAWRYEYRNGGAGKVLISHQGQVRSWNSP